MGIKCFQVERIPDLSLNKYQSLADTGIDGLLNRHENFLRQWHGICHGSTVSFHLLYAWVNSEPVGKRMKLYFILQGEEEEIEMMEPLLQNSPLGDFYSFKMAELPQMTFGAGGTLTKKERVAEIYNPMTGQTANLHYVPAWKMYDKARLYDLFRMMQTVTQSYSAGSDCAFRVDLYPASMEQETRACFQPVLKSLRGDNDIRLLRETDSVKEDSYAQDISQEYEDWITAIETTPHFRVNIYGFADSMFKVKVLLNAAASEALDEGDYSVAPIREDADGSYRLESRMGDRAEDYCFFPEQARLKKWSTTYCLPEVLPFFRFPVLYDGESIEIPKETASRQDEDGLYFGQDTQNYPVYFPLKYMARHAFFTGMPGSGKTNTMMHLVTQLRKQKIPFLALEPAKKEYRSLLGHEDMQDICLFSPHLQSRFPLHMNPMAFPKGVRLSEHINALMEVFQGSFLLEGPTYKFLSSAIQKVYIACGWDMEDTNDENCTLSFPCLQDVYDKLKDEIEASSYDGELKGNMTSFLQVRLGGLMERDAGEVFNTRYSTVAPEEWLTTSAVVELEVLGEQAKNFFVLMVCHYILESLRADPNGGVDEKGEKVPVRHVMFIEEAHNIIAPSSQQSGSDSVDPKISATAYIVKMLAEVRALRESIVIADQLPTALAVEVTKNTGLKLVHRLSAQDDRAQIGSAISATPLQLEQMANFTIGNALMHHEKTQKPFQLQIAEWKQPKIDYDIANDYQLYEHIKNCEQIQNAVIVSLRNWSDRCRLEMEKELELLKERIGKINGDLAEKILCMNGKQQLISKMKVLWKKYHRRQALWMAESEGMQGLSAEFLMIKGQFEKIETEINDLQVKKGE